MTSTALHNKSADREMLFSADLPDELLDRYITTGYHICVTPPVLTTCFNPMMECVRQIKKESCCRVMLVDKFGNFGGHSCVRALGSIYMCVAVLAWTSLHPA